MISRWSSTGDVDGFPIKALSASIVEDCEG